MTFLRRVAAAISERVVRWASPGCKEWAEGLARESEFVDSDWGALAWALGSVRVVLDRRESQIRTSAELPLAAKQLHEKRTKQTRFVYLIGILSVAFWVRILFFGHAAIWHGIGLWIGTSIAMVFHAYARRPRAIPASEHPSEIAAYYRAEIKRDGNFKKGLFSQVGMLALLICVDGKDGRVVASVIVWAAFLVLFYLVGRHYERRMARLDALMEQMQ